VSDAIITVEGLGKRYSLSHLRDQRYIALRDVIADQAKSFFKKLKSRNGVSVSLRAVSSTEPEAEFQRLSVSATDDVSVSAF
jgi:hypothetical protein